jgi:uncharacterized protein with GYD domain
MPTDVALVNWTDQASRTFATPSAGPSTTGGLVEKNGGQVRQLLWLQCGPLARPLEALRPTETT